MAGIWRHHLSASAMESWRVRRPNMQHPFGARLLSLGTQILRQNAIFEGFFTRPSAEPALYCSLSADAHIADRLVGGGVLHSCLAGLYPDRRGGTPETVQQDMFSSAF